MPRATQEQSELTALRLRDVARGLFAEFGFAAVSVEQIAEGAGVTRGAVYHHFAGKHGLFEAVLADAHQRIGAAVAEAAPGEGWDAIVSGSLAFLRAASDPALRRIVLVDGPAVVGWEVWRESDAENSARLLAEGLAELDDLSVDPAAAGALLSGAMNEAALWIAGGGHPQLAEQALVKMIAALRS